MKMYEMANNRLLFVFNNKDIKMLKRSIVPVDCRLAKDNKQVVFSFISEENYPKKVKEYVDLRNKTQVEKAQREFKTAIKEKEDGQKE